MIQLTKAPILTIHFCRKFRPQLLRDRKRSSLGHEKEDTLIILLSAWDRSRDSTSQKKPVKGHVEDLWKAVSKLRYFDILHWIEWANGRKCSALNTPEMKTTSIFDYFDGIVQPAQIHFLNVLARFFFKFLNFWIKKKKKKKKKKI